MTPILKRTRRSALDQIRRHGVQIRRIPPSIATDRGESAIELTIEHLITLHLVDSVPGFFFVQVGAFDGITNDPINRMVTRYDWAGVLVEPQPAAFERLTTTYAEHPKLQLRNVAVGDRDGTVALYYVRDAPAWVDLLQIDAEGSDGLLIEMFDLARWQPSIIQFEHRHLSLDEHEAALRRLIAHGYRVATAPFDTLAYRDSRLTGRSRAGSPGADRGQ
jgi:hypothetical protein